MPPLLTPKLRSGRCIYTDIVYEILDLKVYRVSSTLDKSVGKKYLTDGNPETCWTSQQVNLMNNRYCHYHINLTLIL